MLGRNVRYAVGLGGLVLLTLPTLAGAATYTVNNTGDADLHAGSTVCETAVGNNICTLRAAIHLVNNRASTDTIAVASGICTISIGTALPTLATSTTMNGAVAGCSGPAVVVDATSMSGVSAWSITAPLVLSNFVVQNDPNASGDCIQVHTGATLTADHITTTSCEDGLYISGVVTVTITNSVFSTNRHNGINADSGATLSLKTSVLLGNNQSGVELNDTGAGGITGALVDGNILGGNGNFPAVVGGVAILTSSCSGNTISNNKFGFAADGVTTDCNIPFDIVDKGTSTTLTANTFNPACLSCCQVDGTNVDFGGGPFSFTCADNTVMGALGQSSVTTLAQCKTNLQNGLGVDPSHVLAYQAPNCVVNPSPPGNDPTGGIASGVCAAAPTNTPSGPTATPTPTAPPGCAWSVQTPIEDIGLAKNNSDVWPPDTTIDTSLSSAYIETINDNDGPPHPYNYGMFAMRFDVSALVGRVIIYAQLSAVSSGTPLCQDNKAFTMGWFDGTDALGDATYQFASTNNAFAIPCAGIPHGLNAPVHWQLLNTELLHTINPATHIVELKGFMDTGGPAPIRSNEVAIERSISPFPEHLDVLSCGAPATVTPVAAPTLNSNSGCLATNATPALIGTSAKRRTVQYWANTSSVWCGPSTVSKTPGPGSGSQLAISQWVQRLQAQDMPVWCIGTGIVCWDETYTTP